MTVASTATRKNQPITQKLQRFSPMPGQNADLALKTSLRSTYQDIKKLREWLGNLAEFAGLPPSDLLELRAAALEAFVYLIEEAYEGEDSGLIKATAMVRGQELRLVLRDFGRQFLKPRLIGAEPSVPDAVGHGLLLIRSLADEVKFHTSLRRGTAIEIMKYLPEQR
jgi:anti-sigma regulatory factor (Ser/Thr protein kinase)